VAIGQAVLLTPDAAPADNGSVEGISAAVAPASLDMSSD
jgi:multidrug resistance efflux pump